MFGQTVYTLDQCIYNNDSTLVLDKSNNLPITGLVRGYFENGVLKYETNYKDGKGVGAKDLKNSINRIEKKSSK